MEQLTDAMIVCPDQPTSRYIAAAIDPANTCRVVVSKRGVEKQVNQWIDDTERPILVLVPSEQPMLFAMEACRRIHPKNGLTLVWSKHSPFRDDRWTLLQLLQSEGAIVIESLDVLALVAHLYRNTSAEFTHIQRTTAKSTVMTHVMDAAATVLTDQAGKSFPKLKMNKNAHIVLEWKKKDIALHSSPHVIGEALATLCTRATRRISDATVSAISPERGIIEMIARPPARILSETTSKRLLGAFGLTSPTETLCESPSQAVRCAKRLNGPATLKLVRPNFRFKSTAGAVIQQVSGPSEIQKAYQSLITLSATLGAPKALGILVCEQVDTPHLFWVEAKRHDTFGRLILFGKRNEITETADCALQAACTYLQCVTAVANTYPELSASQASSLSEAIFRFASMCTQLSDHIGLAQIHPIALTERGALMLDALVGITDASQH